jgi:hypothetical protein
MFWLYARFRAREKEPLDAFVPEGLNHSDECNI